MLNDFPPEIKSFLGDMQRITCPRQGCTSEVVIAECMQGKYALKHSQIPPYSGWLQQEYQVLQALASSPLPIPHTHLFVSRVVSGQPENWLVMDYLPGLSLQEALETASNVAVRRDLLYKFGQVLAIIHQTSLPAVLITNRPWLANRLDQAEQNLRRYQVDGTPELLERLRQVQPPPTTPTLIHGDFTPDNVLIDAGAVGGVIDWAGGASGDPRHDLALATRPQPFAFETPGDFRAFFAGYGGSRLSQAECQYFVDLYEFF